MAPQIYFKGETVCNLKKELLRASKLNCYQCGKKGAALGCYVKSCRKSYHVPCAYGISECRWDCENYHVLCPAHRGRMLPCDESNEANELLHYADLSWNLIPATKQQVYESRASSSWENTNWILCGSALSDEEQVFLEKFAILSGSEVTSSWKENVTHVIASTNEHGACNRTMKYLISILTGKWILSINWLKACIKAGHPVAEEPYEISHDVHGVFYGPKTGRIRLAKKAPKLFAGLSFIFVGHINPVVKGFLENLVITGGGVLKSQNSSNYEDISPDLFVVYGVNSIEECEVDESRKRDAEAFAAKIGARAIPHCWILETVAACHLRM